MMEMIMMKSPNKSVGLQNFVDPHHSVRRTGKELYGNYKCMFAKVICTITLPIPKFCKAALCDPGKD
ncbi:hypothetical protein GDO81_010875 [Engystomops pustulosus]|uniref:Uncharacterized protein n=1 Tax=Engystomops pustulosus TaxID=76066 RepID=A0AAV7C460_ENGPU|nr:hypothetical protein GDO81_010875 [Engystomops pustulosus]